MPDGDQRFDVQVTDERGRRAAVAPGLAAWLRRVAPARTRGVVSVALVSDLRVRELNRVYRRKDCATDVLSFPSGASSVSDGRRANRANRRNPPNPPNSQPLVPTPFLGDIVIARGVARRQARAAGHAERIELRILALHGLLHLLGYDHEHDDGRMLRLERRLRRKGGVRQGLIERARPSTGSGRANWRRSTGRAKSHQATGSGHRKRARPVERAPR